MRLVALLLIMSVVLTGCSSVKTYTYKRDRVDQEVQKGNRGFMKGTPPPAKSREGLKRTLYGCDIEIPIMPWEKGRVSIPPEGQKGKVDIPPAEDQKTIYEIPDRSSKTTTIKGEVVDEEEWIK
ncbi:MAG: hypothetical protein HQ579_05020 [Candidatus Omnitrophica bacterium]|nr:hypothetical protein [Candidatus Omnitrophota bacterium]